MDSLRLILSAYSYKDISQQAREYGIPGNFRRDILIDAIVAVRSGDINKAREIVNKEQNLRRERRLSADIARRENQIRNTLMLFQSYGYVNYAQVETFNPFRDLLATTSSNMYGLTGTGFYFGSQGNQSVTNYLPNSLLFPVSQLSRTYVVGNFGQEQHRSFETEPGRSTQSGGANSAPGSCGAMNEITPAVHINSTSEIPSPVNVTRAESTAVTSANLGHLMSANVFRVSTGLRSSIYERDSVEINVEEDNQRYTSESSGVGSPEINPLDSDESVRQSLVKVEKSE